MNRPPRRRSAALVLALALGAVAGACSGHTSAPKPVPPVTELPTTTYVDHSTDSLGTVAGHVTVPSVPLTPGSATLNGTVVGDDGLPVPGADIHLERVVGSAIGSADVAAAADGTWSAPGIIGGLYRVRAWRAPDLAETTPQILFLGATDVLGVNIKVSKFTGLQVTSSIAPNPPFVNVPASLVVEVAVATVGSDGVVRGQGQPGATVELTGGGGWELSSPGTETTSNAGTVTYQLTCVDLAAQSLSVVVDGNQTFPLNLPGCAPVPTTTTTTPTTIAGSTTSTPAGVTTTTRRRPFGGTSTTG